MADTRIQEIKTKVYETQRLLILISGRRAVLKDPALQTQSHFSYLRAKFFSFPAKTFPPKSPLSLLKEYNKYFILYSKLLMGNKKNY